MSENLTCGYVSYLHATPEQVWQALTDPDATSAWWGHANVSDWAVGSTWEHRALNGELSGSGEVLESDRPQRLAMTFPAGENGSRVAFDIEPYQDIVRLTLTHTELDSDQLRAIVASVWAAVLSNLKTYLESGKPLPQSPLDTLGLG